MNYLLRAYFALALLLAAREGHAQTVQPCPPSTNAVARLCELDRPFLEGARRMVVRYPDIFLQSAVGGDVRIRYEVDTAGRPDMRTVQIISSTHSLLDRAVRTAVAGEQYFSPRRSGAPVRVQIDASIAFRAPNPPLRRMPVHEFGVDSSGVLTIRVGGYVSFDSTTAPVLTTADRTDILVAITRYFIANTRPTPSGFCLAGPDSPMVRAALVALREARPTVTDAKGCPRTYRPMMVAGPIVHPPEGYVDPVYIKLPEPRPWATDLVVIENVGLSQGASTSLSVCEVLRVNRAWGQASCVVTERRLH